MRAHFAGAVVDDEDRRRNARADGEGMIARQGFERGLEIARDGRLLHGALRRLPGQPLGDVGSEHGEGKAALRGSFGRGGLGLVGIDDASTMQKRDHPVAGGDGALGKAVGPPGFGRLRQCHEERAFGGGQALRLLAEIGKRCGARAFDVAAIGGECQIEVEDLLLAEAALQLHGAHHLGQLVGEAAFGARFEQAGDLHGERRSAGDDVAMGDGLPGSAHQRPRVHAMMLVEALVLIGEEHGEEARVDVVRRHGQAPVAVTRDEGAEQAAVPVGDERRIGEVPAERQGPQPAQHLARREAYDVDCENDREQPRIEAQRPSAAGRRHVTAPSP